MSSLFDPLLDPHRDTLLAAHGLVKPDDPELSRIAELAARGTGLPMGLVTIVGSGWQTFVGQAGLPADLGHAAGTPRSWSFCQHAVRKQSPLVVEEARGHALVGDSPLVELGLVQAYAGVPFDVPGVGTVGTVCALSATPRAIDAAQMATLELAASLASEILTRRARKATASPRGAAAVPAAAEAARVRGALAPGDLLDDKYWITAALGEGGQSRVYLARGKLGGQLVAIKVTHGDEKTLQHEAQTLCRLRHANIVQLHGWGKAPAGDVYLVLEYVQGETLQDRIDAAAACGELPSVASVVDIVTRLAGALASMHALGYVHADVKPLNVMLDPVLDRPVLIDFGLGLPLDPAFPSPSVVGGTPGFSAPEQMLSQGELRPHASFDTYALAATAFAMLTGTGPFDAALGAAPLARQLKDDPVALRALRPELPAEAEQLFASALSREPWKRPETPIAFADALRKTLASVRGAARSDRPPIEQEPASRGGVVLALRAEVARLVGEPSERAIVARLSDEERRALTSVEDATRFHPATPLVAYLRAYSNGDVAVLDAIGSRAGRDAVRAALRSLRIAHTPEALLSVAGTLHHRFHNWGRVQVTHKAPNASTLRLLLPQGYTPIMCAYLGGVLRALLSETGRAVTLAHTECGMTSRDSCCVFEVSWRGA